MFGEFAINSEVVVGHPEANLWLWVGLEFGVGNEFARFEQDDGVGADGFDRQLRRLQFSKLNGFAHKPGGEVLGVLLGEEFRKVVEHAGSWRFGVDRGGQWKPSPPAPLPELGEGSRSLHQ